MPPPNDAYNEADIREYLEMLDGAEMFADVRQDFMRYVCERALRAAPPTTKPYVHAFSIKVGKDDGVWFLHGEEIVPGLNLCGEDLGLVLADLIPAWKALHEVAPEQVPAPPAVQNDTAPQPEKKNWEGCTFVNDPSQGVVVQSERPEHPDTIALRDSLALEPVGAHSLSNEYRMRRAIEEDANKSWLPNPQPQKETTMTEWPFPVDAKDGSSDSAEVRAPGSLDMRDGFGIASAHGQPLADGDLATQRAIHDSCREKDERESDFNACCFKSLCLKNAEELRALRSASGEPDYKKLYHELLYAVGKKYPGETRHHTALRYILNAERGDGIAKVDSRAASTRTKP